MHDTISPLMIPHMVHRYGGSDQTDLITQDIDITAVASLAQGNW